MKSFIEHEPLLALLILVMWLIAVRISLGLWLLKKHKDTSIFRRFFWSIITFIPVVGPLFYGAFYKIPSCNPGGGSQLDPGSYYDGSAGY